MQPAAAARALPWPLLARWRKRMELTLNGKGTSIDVDPQTPLLWVLREQLGLTGTKFGCGKGLCGACTVHLNGAAIRSCSVPVSAAMGQSVTTIEGLSSELGHSLLAILMRSTAPKSALLYIAVLIVVFNGASSLAPGFVSLTVLRFLSGFPHGAFFGVGALVGARIAGPEHAGSAFAIMLGGLTASTVADPSLDGVGGSRHDLRWLCRRPVVGSADTDESSCGAHGVHDTQPGIGRVVRRIGMGNHPADFPNQCERYGVGSASADAVDVAQYASSAVGLFRTGDRSFESNAGAVTLVVFRPRWSAGTLTALVVTQRGPRRINLWRDRPPAR
jgi:hypothetical protein